MRKSFRSMLWMAIGVNIMVFVLGVSVESTDLSLLALGSAACCAIGLYTVEDD